MCHFTAKGRTSNRPHISLNTPPPPHTHTHTHYHHLSGCQTNVQKHNSLILLLQSYTRCTTGEQKVGDQYKRFLHKQPVLLCSIHTGTQSGKQGVLRVLWRAWACCWGAWWPERLLPLFHLFAHLFHLLTLRLCLSVLVSLATCLQQWSELWPQHGRSMVPWRGKAGASEMENWQSSWVKRQSEGTGHSVCHAQTRRSKSRNRGLNRRRNPEIQDVDEHDEPALAASSEFMDQWRSVLILRL